VKVVPAVADDLALIEVERTRGRGFAEKLSMRVLSRTWQMLLKGITEVGEAGRPLAAAEMVLVRIAYAADLPTPDEVIRSLSDGSGSMPPAQGRSGNGGGASVGASASAPTRLAMPSASFSAPTASASRGAPQAALASAPARDPVVRAPDAASSAPALVIGRFEDLIALAAKKRDIGVKLALERDVRLVRCEDGRLEIRLEPSAAKTLVNDLARKISDWTGRRWMVVVSAEEGEATVKAQNDARQAELKVGVRADPLVQAVLARFPGAEIVDVRKADAITAQGLPAGDSDDAGPELPPDDDGSRFGHADDDL
jgi:DNA polymerase III subunit gamma/tau